MFRLVTSHLALACCLGLVACSGSDSDGDSSEDRPRRGEETRVVFNPSAGDLPIPNDLLFARETANDGTMHAGYDPANPVLTGIDALDGNSVLAPMDIAFSGSLDPNQPLDAASFITHDGNVLPNPNQNIFLLPLAFPGGDALVQAQADIDGDGANENVEVPTFAEAMQYQQAVATSDLAALAELATPTARAEIISLDGGTNNVLRINPLEPLQPETKYLIVITNRLQDSAGFAVEPSHAYAFIRDPESPFDADDATIASLRSLRSAINNWERLAAGYFGFMQSVYDAADSGHSAPTAEDIVMTLSFTTGGTDAVLKSLAAPETFFEKTLRRDYRQAAIAKLVSGEYNVSGDNSGVGNATDGAINSTLHFLLTAEQLPNQAPNPLYNANIAAAVKNGTSYSTLAEDPAVAFRLQTAAAEAALQVHNSGAAERGDVAPFVDIATEARGTVVALSGGNPPAVPIAFPLPSARATSFFRQDSAAAVNGALQAPAQVFQGQITLPAFQPVPDGADASTVKNSRWVAGALGGGAVSPPQDPEGEIPPRVTYRYPFPAKQADVTVPLLAVLPDSATLTNFGITKPAAGWPVVIYVHGIGTDRSTALPVANALAFACVNANLTGPSGAPCFATVAIDQPLHGIAPAGSLIPGLVSATDPDSSLQPNLNAEPAADLTERHFDLTADAQSNPIPMDYAADQGESGSLFINLTNFTNSQGNMLQMVMDLLNLNASLAAMDIDGNGAADDLDTSRVYLVGHSLGAISGTAFLAVNNDAASQASPFSDLPQVRAAALLNTGGGIARLLVNSPSFAPRILPGLANASDELVQGQSGLETYLNVFQGVLDTADAMTFAGDVAAQGTTGVLLTEIVGDGSEENPADRTIPNAADTRWGTDKGPLELVLSNGFSIAPFPAPLAGTEPLVAAFDAQPSHSPANDTGADVLVTRFTEGSHGTPVTAGNTQADPLTSGAVFAEMVRQMTLFFAQDGSVDSSIVTDASVLEAASE